jgi:hypothetical protein
VAKVVFTGLNFCEHLKQLRDILGVQNVCNRRAFERTVDPQPVYCFGARNNLCANACPFL